MPAIPVIALAATAIGAGVSAYGAIQQGNATKAADDYQAQVARNNATIASNNANAATAAGTAQAEQEQMKNAQRMGAIMTGQASSGLDVGSGSDLAVRTSEAGVDQLDVMTIRNNAARQAYGYQTQSMSDTAQAGLDVTSGADAQDAGYIGGVSSILGGASSLGKNYEDLSKDGAFGSSGPLVTGNTIMSAYG